MYFQAQPRLKAPNHTGTTHLVEEILLQARSIIRHPSKPFVIEDVLYSNYPYGDLQVEKNLEDPLRLLENEDLWVGWKCEKEISCTAMMDLSYSMTGEKHLLSSIAAAVLLLESPSSPRSIVTFASEAEILKPALSGQSIEKVIERFLQIHPKGFTNISQGLKQGLATLVAIKAMRKIGILVTDGRSTEGEDPLPLAKQFDCLLVLHLHGPGSYAQGSQELAMASNGFFLPVKKFEDLPQMIYQALKICHQRY